MNFNPKDLISRAFTKPVVPATPGAAVTAILGGTVKRRHTALAIGQFLPKLDASSRANPENFLTEIQMQQLLVSGKISRSAGRLLRECRGYLSMDGYQSNKVYKDDA